MIPTPIRNFIVFLGDDRRVMRCADQLIIDARKSKTPRLATFCAQVLIRTMLLGWMVYESVDGARERIEHTNKERRPQQ